MATIAHHAAAAIGPRAPRNRQAGPLLEPFSPLSASHEPLRLRAPNGSEAQWWLWGWRWRCGRFCAARDCLLCFKSRLSMAELLNCFQPRRSDRWRCPLLSGHLSALLGQLRASASNRCPLHLELGCWRFGMLHYERQVGDRRSGAEHQAARDVRAGRAFEGMALKPRHGRVR